MIKVYRVRPAPHLTAPIIVLDRWHRRRMKWIAVLDHLRRYGSTRDSAVASLMKARAQGYWM